MDIPYLIFLSKLGCCQGSVKISSSKLANNLGTSQQTAARKIQKLESEGYISREVHYDGQMVRLTSKGVEVLRNLQQDINDIFIIRKSNEFFITGVISSGLGEGRYYMKIKGYKKQFQEKLGFEPYPGTLNIKLSTNEDIRISQQIREQRGMMIKGFNHNNRTFGSVKCFKAYLKGTEGAIIIPARSHHSFDSLEFIASSKVRIKEGLKDGDSVTVKIEV